MHYSFEVFGRHKRGKNIYWGEFDVWVFCYLAIFNWFSSLCVQKFTIIIFREKRSREAQRQNESNSTSLMLVTVVTIFLIVNLPQAFLLALLCLNSTFGLNIPFLNGSFTTIFMLCSNMCVMVRFFDPFNVFIQFFLGYLSDQFWHLLFHV